MAIICALLWIVALGSVVSMHSHDVEEHFKDYIVQFNKTYSYNVEEYQTRFRAFQRSLAIINSMNKFRTHKDSARYGITEYSDMSHDEFITTKLNGGAKGFIKNRISNSIIKEKDDRRNKQSKYNIIRYVRDTVSNGYNLPKRVDWRESGVVSDIRNQGLCGACWAHSVIATIESMLAIERNSSTIELSVQQMIDCASHNNHGCNGGDTCNLLEWLVQEKVNIHTMAAYPMSADTQCKMSDIKNISQIIQVKSFTCNSFILQEEKILHFLANHGPVATAVNGLLWQNYLGGVIQFHCDGSLNSLNHAVQIVGYDTTGEVPYYIVRNSWGRKFGDKGYMKIQIGGNVCGVANQVSTLKVNIEATKLT